jgi:hypothetical protein
MAVLEAKHDREINALWTAKGREMTRLIHKR